MNAVNDTPDEMLANARVVMQDAAVLATAGITRLMKRGERVPGDHRFQPGRGGDSRAQSFHDSHGYIGSAGIDQLEMGACARMHGTRTWIAPLLSPTLRYCPFFDQAKEEMYGAVSATSN